MIRVSLGYAPLVSAEWCGLPVIRVVKSDLERLVGRRLSNEEIMDLLPRVKCEVEVVEEDGTIEYEATHDRPDLYSAEGLARSLRALLGLPVHRYKFVDEGFKAYNRGVPRRPYAAFAVVRDLSLDDEAVKQIMQLQEKLATTYGRRRRKASVGVYDLDTFKPPIYYELRDPIKTRFTPLEEAKEMSLQEILVETEKGRIYRHLLKGWEKYPVLRDKDGRILSMPPIINSEDTKVTVETRNVLIDSTGIDPVTVVDIVTIMATSIAERSRTGRIVYVETIYPDKSVVRAPKDKGRVVIVNTRDVSMLLGVELGVKELGKLLSSMGHSVEKIDDERLRVTAPPYRIDILNYTDIAEDAAMALGYGVIGRDVVGLPPATHPGRLHPLEFLSRIMRKILVGYGFIEVANYMMSNPGEQLGLLRQGDLGLIRVSNPKMEKYTALRRWLAPGLLNTYIENHEKHPELKIFEIGDVAIPSEESETGAVIERRLGILVSHSKATLTDGIAYLTVIMDRLGLKPIYRKKEIKGFLPQRTSSIVIDGEEIGFVGEVHPEILYNHGVENPVVIVEITLDKLLKSLNK